MRAPLVKRVGAVEVPAGTRARPMTPYARNARLVPKRQT
jgi:hypothetical protein